MCCLLFSCWCLLCVVLWLRLAVVFVVNVVVRVVTVAAVHCVVCNVCVGSCLSFLIVD